MPTSPEVFLQNQTEENERLANQAERMRLLVATSNLCLATALQITLTILGLERKAFPLTLWMIGLGVYGVCATSKLYERESYHRARVRKLRSKLDSFSPEAGREEIFREVEAAHQHISPWLWKMRLNTILVGLHVSLLLVGMIESGLCLR